MKEKTATLIGFITVPIIPTLVGAVLTPETMKFDFTTILVFAVIFYFISAIVAAVIGAPIFFWLRRIDLVRWWSGLIAGFGFGALVAVVVRLPTLAHLREVLLMGLEGAVSALVFWLIWKQGRQST